jgi:hypothetical protein
LLIKVTAIVGVEVDDEAQAERACSTLDSGLGDRLAGFPEGEIVGVEVEHWEGMTVAEADEKGWTE